MGQYAHPSWQAEPGSYGCPRGRRPVLGSPENQDSFKLRPILLMISTRLWSLLSHTDMIFPSSSWQSVEEAVSRLCREVGAVETWTDSDTNNRDHKVDSSSFRESLGVGPLSRSGNTAGPVCELLTSQGQYPPSRVRKSPPERDSGP